MQSKVAGVVGGMDTLALVQIADDVALELRRHLARGEQALFEQYLGDQQRSEINAFAELYGKLQSFQRQPKELRAARCFALEL